MMLMTIRLLAVSAAVALVASSAYGYGTTVDMTLIIFEDLGDLDRARYATGRGLQDRCRVNLGEPANEDDVALHASLFKRAVPDLAEARRGHDTQNEGHQNRHTCGSDHRQFSTADHADTQRTSPSVIDG